MAGVETSAEGRWLGHGQGVQVRSRAADGGPAPPAMVGDSSDPSFTAPSPRGLPWARLKGWWWRGAWKAAAVCRHVAN